MSTDQLFPYDDLIEGSIRLLQGRLNGDGELSYSLTQHKLSEDLDYDALSYAWGLDGRTVSIKCNRTLFFITPHLHNALKRMHESSERFSSPIWIDAICINQASEHEKMMQIPLMGDVYRFANKVRVWLGPPSDDNTSALQALPEIVNKLREIYGQITLTNQSLSEISLPATDNPLWPSLGRLFAVEWFKRVWTVQEMVLAKALVFLYGNISIEGSEMISLAESLRSTGLIALTRGNYIPKAGKTDGYHFPTLITRFAEAKDNNTFVRLDLLFQLVRSRKAKYQADQVYGILGLADKRIRLEIAQIPHNQSLCDEYQELFVSVGKICVREYPGLLLLAMQPSKKPHARLPSWCLDFSSERESSPFSYECYSSGTYNPSLGYPRPDTAQLVSNFKFDNTTLSLEGWLVGTIENIANGFEDWDNDPEANILDFYGHMSYTMSWMDECLDLAQRVTKQQDVVPEAYLRTIIADIFDKTPGRELEVLQESYRLLKIYVTSIQNKVTISNSITSSQRTIVYNYFDSIFHACRSRRMFTTGDRLCLGPKQVRVGDAIVVFPQANMPFILRREGTDGVWKLLGPAYVRGLMQGQVFGLLAEGNLERAAFEIV